MANEEKKDFNAMLAQDNGMPKIQIVTDPATIRRYGGSRMYFAPPKAGGELNPKYPGGVEAQRARLEAEGHTILARGRKNVRYYVKDYENVLFVPQV